MLVAGIICLYGYSVRYENTYVLCYRIKQELVVNIKVGIENRYYFTLTNIVDGLLCSKFKIRLVLVILLNIGM